jgi:hypothetical protein
MYKYLIKYKEFGRNWSSTYYYSTEPKTKSFLISFFGLNECEDFEIVEEK